MDQSIMLFEQVRDLPFHMPDSTCWSKHRRLKKLLEKSGFKVRYRVCSFKWSDQKFPKKVIDIKHRDEDYHLFLEVLVDGKWITVDASNDSKLPSYNRWNGVNDCRIAVNYIRIFSPEESQNLEEKEVKEEKSKNESNSEFYKAINQFLNSIR
jgi:RecG-like helicase